jgi:hypothetical protein
VVFDLGRDIQEAGMTHRHALLIFVVCVSVLSGYAWKALETRFSQIQVERAIP